MTSDIQHPAFPQPDDLGINLWRYMDLFKFQWMLDHNRLFMPALKKIGPDVLEGTQPLGDKKWWDEQIDNEADEEKKQVLENNAKIILGFSRMFCEYYFVMCWHMNSSESEEMWGHYTSDSDSLVIKTVYSNLKLLLPSSSYMGIVRYINYMEEKLPSLNLFEFVMHKDIRYEFETEVRVLAAPLTNEDMKRKEFDGHIFQMEADSEFMFYAPEVSIVSLIEEIILHPQASAEFTSKIENICHENGLPQPTKSIFEVA
ncbi:hypothetical protein FM037_02920 [Shewanella psychropiezotolerans]|uniref:DUF2971 domain-containing protein n=1 Tax=Shewanella psychropiezotolerans TaxID=2593655 RepID=A0ABX5WU20_9GAMM|nr:hypothetical protein [Shewanella psychropiezotolerans]QDO82383.1 hypothetical protein FM037_02920 [Shewanella psychropiezotolerans]